jgi:hypothetical protein
MAALIWINPGPTGLHHQSYRLLIEGLSGRALAGRRGPRIAMTVQLK